MTHTFDIRFARSAGLTALFEAPVNRFRWKGAGKLSVDAHGISIAVKRGVTNLFSRRRSHRIAAHALTEVYREGDALRLEFGADEAREVLPIWTADNAAAAEIVKLLPTTRTVEIEHSTRPRKSFRFDWHFVAWLALAVVAATALFAWLAFPRAPGPAAMLVETPAVPVEAPELPIERILATEGVKPIPPGTPEHDVARRQQELFESELAMLRGQYPQLQAITSAEALEALQPQWWAVALRIETSEEMSGPAFLGFREAQLAVVSSWRAALALRAAGIRLHDERFTELAEKQRELAELYEPLVRAYVP